MDNGQQRRELYNAKVRYKISSNNLSVACGRLLSVSRLNFPKGGGAVPLALLGISKTEIERNSNEFSGSL